MKKKYRKPKVKKIKTDISDLIKTCKICPYLFIWNGRKYYKENSLLPNSENLLRREKVLTDYYILDNEPVVKDNNLSFKIKELGNDISYFDYFELLTFEHSKRYNITYSNKNVPYSFDYSNLLKPESCMDRNGKDWAKVFKYSKCGMQNYYSAKAKDYLKLEFEKPEQENVRLLIYDPKNNEPFDITRPDSNNRHEKTSIHIYIFIEGKYKKIDVIHTRANFYPDIIDLTPYLTKIKKDERIKIKLEFTDCHKVGFVALDIVSSVFLNPKKYFLEKTVHSRKGKVTEDLNKRNNKFTRLLPGEEIKLNFPVPESPKNNNKLSYCLKSRGYYIPVPRLVAVRKNEMAL